jgi:hypothetical protein
MKPLSDDDFDPCSPRMLFCVVAYFSFVWALLDYLGFKPC